MQVLTRLSTARLCLSLWLMCVCAVAVNAQTAQRAPTADDAAPQTNLRSVDASVPDDAGMVRLLAPYKGRVAALDNPIGTLATKLDREGIGAGTLGNFVADALRAEASRRTRRPIEFAFINRTGMRKTEIDVGKISTRDIYELLPFENALVLVDLTGEQLLRILDALVTARDAQSGAVVSFRSTGKKDGFAFAGAALRHETNARRRARRGVSFREERINPREIYTILTIDYLVNAGDNYAVLQEVKRVRPLGLTMRDAMIAYVKAETSKKRPLKAMLDGRFRSIDNQSATSTAPSNQTEQTR